MLTSFLILGRAVEATTELHYRLSSMTGRTSTSPSYSRAGQRFAISAAHRSGTNLPRRRDHALKSALTPSIVPSWPSEDNAATTAALGTCQSSTGEYVSRLQR